MLGFGEERELPADCSDPVIKRWGHGQCHALTLALHRRTGWPILTLHDSGVTIDTSYLEEFGSVLHSGVVHPDGDFIDIRGKHDPEAMERIAAYYVDEDRSRWACVAQPREVDLLECMDRHDLIDAAIFDADKVIEERLLPCLETQPGMTAADAERIVHDRGLQAMDPSLRMTD